MCFCDTLTPVPVYTTPLYTQQGFYSAYEPSRSVFHSTAAGRVVPGSSRSIFSRLFGGARPAPRYFSPGTQFAAHPPVRTAHPVPRPVAVPPAHHAHRPFRGVVKAPGLF